MVGRENTQAFKGNPRFDRKAARRLSLLRDVRNSRTAADATLALAPAKGLPTVDASARSLRHASSSNALVACVCAALARGTTCPARRVVASHIANVVLTTTCAERRPALAKCDARAAQARLPLRALRAGVSANPARTRVSPRATDTAHATALAVLRAACNLADRSRRVVRSVAGVTGTAVDAQ